MTKCNTFNVNLSNSRLSKLTSGTKNSTEVSLNLSLTLIGNSNDKTNFPHKLLLTDTQVSRIRKSFANGLSDYTQVSNGFANDPSAINKFLKTELSKMMRLAGSVLSDAIDATNPSFLIPSLRMINH